jgi:hypothetical protein
MRLFRSTSPATSVAALAADTSSSAYVEEGNTARRHILRQDGTNRAPKRLINIRDEFVAQQIFERAPIG